MYDGKVSLRGFRKYKMAQHRRQQPSWQQGCLQLHLRAVDGAGVVRHRVRRRLRHSGCTLLKKGAPLEGCIGSHPSRGPTHHGLALVAVGGSWMSSRAPADTLSWPFLDIVHWRRVLHSPVGLKDYRCLQEDD